MKIKLFSFRKILIILFIFWILTNLSEISYLCDNDPSNCPIHDVPLEKIIVPIIYGLPYESEFEEAKIALLEFPFGRDYILGGCLVKWKDKAIISICNSCKKERHKWLSENSYINLNKP